MTNGENIFDELWAENELPPEAKKDLMSNLEAFKMILEITDLFTVKQVQADMELLSAMGTKSIKESGE